MREVEKNIFMEVVALPNNPLKTLNVYIIKGEDHSLIIDTGFNREETKRVLEGLMEDLDLEVDRTELFLTHLHSDHTGLAYYFASQGMRVYASRVDGQLLNQSVKKTDPMWQETLNQGHIQGLDEDQLNLEDHPGYRFRPEGYVDYVFVDPGDPIQVGDYTFEVVDLKGHTPGMVGLYERDQGILFSGDHILSNITPNITFWGFDYGDSLGIYLDSLDRVYQMDIKSLYSSHRDLIKDPRGRIDQLRAHHAHRLEEAKRALKNLGKARVREVTRQLHWDIRARSWEDFPKAQKWFAAGEAHAHLEHLRALGQVDFERDPQGVLYYYLK
ncbi:MAG: MBL fold metallo-hydrolase [Tissierellia bacterium]|nr:MBL fold metallo-hydrolase [Tissierellia bacterium]